MDDSSKPQLPQWNKEISFENFLLEDLTPDQQIDQIMDNKTDAFPFASNYCGKSKKESKASQIFNIYLDLLQMNGFVDNNDFLKSFDGDYRRKLGQIIAVLKYFGIVQKEKSVVKLCCKTHLNPPIKIKFLEEEIKKLENEIDDLKEQLNEAQSKLHNKVE
ncbi:hypothetical protein M9Y10_013267 [Tritrichomonas musculus]|uniref:Centrosomal protein of 44 kDa n=1 Tax=Tritrichomonas musculus TaxID=1915356 RepID=A0ABR2I7F7_9EUKA